MTEKWRKNACPGRQYLEWENEIDIIFKGMNEIYQVAVF